VLAVLVVIGLVWSVVEWVPLGPATTVRGVILKIAPYNGWGRYERQLVTVDINGTATVLSPLAAKGCAVGDAMLLRQQRHVFGVSLIPGYGVPCKPRS